MAALARRAHDDPAALDRLKRVTDVDGTSVNMAQALDGAEGEDLDRRLDLIESAASHSGDVAIPGVATNGPRESAERILAQKRYRPKEPPRPLAGVIHRLGQWLEPVGKPLLDFLAAVYRTWWLLGLVGLAVVGLVALASVRMARGRRYAPLADGEGAFAASRSLDPDELERQADAAERAGLLDQAFRLRFQAGVLRLDRAGAVRYRPSLTTGELVREVRSTTLRGLAADFDRIAYGQRVPQAEDVDRAKQAWPRVLEEARR